MPYCSPSLFLRGSCLMSYFYRWIWAGLCLAASKSLHSSASVCVYNTSLLLKQTTLRGTRRSIIIHANKYFVFCLYTGQVIFYMPYRCTYQFPNDNKPRDWNILHHMTGSLYIVSDIMEWIHVFTVPFKQIYVLCQCLVSSSESQIPHWSLFMTRVVCNNPTKGWMQGQFWLIDY